MEIKIYTTPTCSWSEKLKQWLKTKKLSFQELDLTESSTARDEILEHTGQMATPVINVDGKFIVGFNEKKLEKLTN